MGTRRIIIDGNNLLHVYRRQEGGAGDFPHARALLARELDEVADELADQVVLVYDGGSSAAATALQTAHVEVVFSGPEQDADTVIEREVVRCRRPGDLLVVSSDLNVVRGAAAAGALTVSCPAFLEQVHDCRRELDRRVRHTTSGSFPPTLGERFPES